MKITTKTTLVLRLSFLKLMQILVDNFSGVVEAFLTLMWASRRGLTEEEIAVLMSGMEYQRNEWSPIFLVMEDMLFRSGALFDIF
jgi:hypothetical protein